MILITSWDDGHPEDERVADLLAKHGVRGTFYVPVRNAEGRPVMDGEPLRRLARAGFEIGGHTLDHRYLTRLSPKDVEEQVSGGKKHLEDLLGHVVEGFCYPGGKVNAGVRAAVLGAGFKHARTVQNLWVDVGGDRYSVPTTLQFFPHRPAVLCGNLIRHGHYATRGRVLAAAWRARHWWNRLPSVAAAWADRSDAVVHLWGHSWEIADMALWDELDITLARLRALATVTVTVTEALAVRREAPA